MVLAADGGSRRRVLEVGGADGFVARLLARRFDPVASVDIRAPVRTWFPVAVYDGKKLPIADATFVLVFSSHVMKHIPNFPDFQREIARVLAPSGVALHIMPSATWRLWTLLAHYPALPRLAFNFLRERLVLGGPTDGHANKQGGWRRLRQAGVEYPLGTLTR